MDTQFLKSCYNVAFLCDLAQKKRVQKVVQP